jgi:hypothetical protein
MLRGRNGVVEGRARVSGADEPQRRLGPPPGHPGDDLLFTGIGLAVMTVFLIFNAMNTYHEHVGSGHPLRFWEPAVWEGSSGLYFVAVSWAILGLTRRVWPLDRPLAPKLAIHLAAALLVSLLHVVTAGLMRWAAYRMLGGYYRPFGPLSDWPYELRKDLLVYAGISGFYVVWRLARRAEPAGRDAEVLEVRDGARRHFVPLTEVVWVEAAGNYVELHRGGAGLLHRASLSEMERRLQTAGFVRIHRSRLVRREAVAAVESKPTGDFTVRLRDGRELAGSRRYRRPLLAD